MYILNLIPLTKISQEHSQIYSYFSLTPLRKGVLVLISLRNFKVLAIIISSNSIASQKMEIRKANFSLKKIDSILSENPILSEHQINLAFWISQYYFTPLTLSFRTIIPKYSFKLAKNKKSILKLDFSIHSETNKNEKKINSSQSLITQNKKERYDFYFEKIKENILEKKQILVLLPNIFLAKSFKKELENFQDNLNIIELLDKTSSKKYFTDWISINNEKTQIIIGSRSAIFAPFLNLGLIIVEEENNENYKSWDQEPKYSAKTAAFELAKYFNAEIILGDKIPSVETYNNIGKSNTPILPINNLKINIIDMKEEYKKGNEIISEQLQNSILSCEKQNKKVLLFSNRRGSSTFIFCLECRYIFKCKNCDRSLVHHQNLNKLFCHLCGFSEHIPLICRSCGGHKIKYFGFGAQKIEEEIRNICKTAKIIRFDSDALKTKKEQENALNQITNETKPLIIIGTQLLLNYPLPKISLAAIVSADALLNLPDFRVGEKILKIVSKLSNFLEDNNRKLIFQTNFFDNSIIQASASENYNKFYQEEIKARKFLNYPPFSQIINLTYKNINLRKTEEAAKFLVQLLETQRESFDLKYEIIGPAPAFIPKIKNQYIWQIILKFILNDLSDKVFTDIEFLKNRNEILKLIPKGWKIDVDPISLG